MVPNWIATGSTYVTAPERIDKALPLEQIFLFYLISGVNQVKCILHFQKMQRAQ